MIVDPCQVKQFITPSRSYYEICHPSGSLAFRSNWREAEALAKHGYIEGVINKHGYLRYMRLLVSVFAAMSIVRRFRRPPVTHNLTITKPAQNGMHWKPRFDFSRRPSATVTPLWVKAA